MQTDMFTDALPDWRMHVLDRVGSTNAWAAEHLDQGELAPPAIVVARHQTAGRGQADRQWHSDAGSLAVTFVLDHRLSPEPATLPLRAGLATIDAIERFAGPSDLQVKWPNDVLWSGRKMAGILCQRCDGGDLVGIGINVTTDLGDATATVRQLATTLAEQVASPPSREALLIELAMQITAVLASHDWRGRYGSRLAFRDEVVTFQSPDTTQRGRLIGIDDEGRLLLRTAEGVQAHWAGRIQMPVR